MGWKEYQFSSTTCLRIIHAACRNADYWLPLRTTESESEGGIQNYFFTNSSGVRGLSWRGKDFRSSEKAMAPHSSTLAWKSPWLEEPGRLQSWGRWGSNITERLHFHFSLSCIGEGNGNPLQCSCLENPRDGEAWWAAVYGVTHSRTRLKWLSNSNSLLLPSCRFSSDPTASEEL